MKCGEGACFVRVGGSFWTGDRLQQAVSSFYYLNPLGPKLRMQKEVHAKCFLYCARLRFLAELIRQSPKAAREGPSLALRV